MYLHSPVYRTHEKPPALSGMPEMPRVVLETPYGPTATETIPDETFAAEVLGTVVESWEATRAADPDFFIGLTLRGSFIKGRARPDSDLDPYVFYDPDASTTTLQKYHLPTAEEADELYSIDTLVETRFRDPMSRLLRARGFGETIAVPEVDYWARNERSIIHSLLGWKEHLLETNLSPDKAWLPSDFPVLFHPQLGSGHLETLRNTIITYLQGLTIEQDGVNGADMWQALMNRVIREEEGRRRATIYLPPLEDASAYLELGKRSLVATGIEDPGL